MSGAYVHGYSEGEAERLNRQANILVPFIHAHSVFAPGARILEAGCGVGSQTLQLAKRNPQARIIAVDRSMDSLTHAQGRIDASGLGNVELRCADIDELPFEDQSFDAVFLCFVLEHLPVPQHALGEIRRVLKPGAKVHAFEGDHGSVLAWPKDPAIGRLVAAVCRHQCSLGGDPFIGRGLYPVLSAAGFQNVKVEPCVAYADASRPEWVEEFTQATFIDMMRLQRDAILQNHLLNEIDWRRGIDALYRTTQADGAFWYTFYRATADR